MKELSKLSIIDLKQCDILLLESEIRIFKVEKSTRTCLKTENTKIINFWTLLYKKINDITLHLQNLIKNTNECLKQQQLLNQTNDCIKEVSL